MVTYFALSSISLHPLGSICQHVGEIRKEFPGEKERWLKEMGESSGRDTGLIPLKERDERKIG